MKSKLTIHIFNTEMFIINDLYVYLITIQQSNQFQVPAPKKFSF